MKKILTIIMAVCLIASVICLTAFAADEPAAGVVLRVSALKKSGTTVVIEDYTSFEDGWNAAMELAGSSSDMKKKAYDRVVVDLYADWNADKDGNFTDDAWYEINGDGFNNDTIYIPADARVTLNLNGHTINRGLTEAEDDGEIIFINDDADVIINNGTLTGGYSNSEGGCLYIEGGANVTLNNVHIVGNSVYNDYGAGIYAYDGATITMNGGSFKDNVTDGGVVFTFYYGGAVYMENCTATFSGVEFKNNDCQNYGAAIYADECEIEIDQCIFDGNKAGLTIVDVDDCTILMKKSTFINNTVGSGVISTNDNSILIVDECSFSNNATNWSTISIIESFYSSFQITNSQFTDNSARAIYVGESGVDSDVESFFENCTFNNNVTAYGSFYGDFSDVVFYDCSFGNSKLDRAENLTIKYTDLSIEDVVISVTVIRNDGTEETIGYKFFDYGWDQAMKFAKSDDVVSVKIDLYADWNSVGGVFGTYKDGFKNDTLYIPSDTVVTVNMNGHTINRCLGEYRGDGEVIYIASDAEIIINNGTITGGYSDNGAGGIHINDNAKVTLNNVNVVKNKVINDDGAGIAVYDGATLIMNGGSVSNNGLICGVTMSTLYGGGIYVENSTAILTGVTIKDNTIESKYTDKMYGSAIYITDSTVTLKDCTVEGNGVTKDNASYFCTYTVYADDSTLVIENTSFIGNGAKNAWQSADHAPYTGSAVICVDDTDFTMTGGKFTDNKQVFLLSVWDSAVNVDGVDFTGNNSFAMYVHDTSSNQNTFANCKFSAGSPYSEFKYDFQFKDEKANVTFVDCDFGNATFSNKNAVTFIGGTVSNGAGSIFGEGSLTNILVIISLAASIASIGISFALYKKKAVPVAANNTKSEDEE